MKFARLFDYTSGQLLLSITTDSTVNGYVLSVETYHQGAFIRTEIPFPTLGDAIESMEALTDQKAQELYQSLIEVIGQPSRAASGGIIEGFESWLNKSQD